MAECWNRRVGRAVAVWVAVGMACSAAMATDETRGIPQCSPDFQRRHPMCAGDGSATTPVVAVVQQQEIRQKQNRQFRHRQPARKGLRTSQVPPVIRVAAGLNQDGSLVKNYKRGLQYAIRYFGNYGPYYVYLLGPKSETSVREIFRQRAASRVNANSSVSAQSQIEAFLTRQNVVNEIKAVLAGKAAGGLTWTQSAPVLYEDVTTNATSREKDPVENTWGALHEYHHVFQMAHCDTTQPRDSDKHINSWIAEGMATYSSAKFMDNLGLADFKRYMLNLRKFGGNIGAPGINDFMARTPDWKLQNENYWDTGQSPQVYYMLGAWATAYLIHAQGIDEQVVLKEWYFDIPRIGKAAAFKKHMRLSLPDFYRKFAIFIRQSDADVMRIIPDPELERQ